MLISDYYGYNYFYNPKSITKERKPFLWDDLFAKINQYKILIGRDLDLYYESYIRSMLHDTFNVVKSQFYARNSYYDICKDITSNLNNKLIRDIINYKVKMAGKLLFAYILIKYRLYFIIKLISMF